MTFIYPDFGSELVFYAVLLWVVAALTWAERRAAMQVGVSFSPRLVLFFLAWCAALGLFVQSGLVEAHPMPLAMVFFVLSNGFALGMGLSSAGSRWATYLPIWSLIGFQSFRLPLEWVLHEWAKQGVVPETMTWTGSNFDVVTGALAPVCALLATQRSLERPVAWTFNVLGFGLLLNVMRVALLSSPVPFGWGLESPLQLAFHMPYAWIVPVCVGGALTGHIVLFRSLRSPQRRAV